MTLIISWRIVGFIAPTRIIRINPKTKVVQCTFCYFLYICVYLIEVLRTVAGGF